MFKLGDKVRLKQASGVLGTVKQIMSYTMTKDKYLVEYAGTYFPPRDWHKEEELELVKLISTQLDFSDKCECGAEKVYGKGTNIHSFWCPKNKKVT